MYDYTNQKRRYTVILTYPVNDVNEPIEYYTAYVKASSRQMAALMARERASIDNGRVIPAEEFGMAFIMDGRITFLSVEGV